MPSIQCTLAGANFRPSEARERCKALRIGEELELEPDPENPYDSNAIKVLADEHFIGFIPKTDNVPVLAAINRGEDLRVTVIAFESAIKPVLEIELDEGEEDLDFEPAD